MPPMNFTDAFIAQPVARAPHLVSAILVAFALADVTHFAFAWRARHAATIAAPAAQPIAMAPEAPDAPASLARIGRLFGAGPGVDVGPSVAAVNFTLAGTLAVADPHRGAAILADAGETGAAPHEQLYAAGARLADGSVLDQVYADRVVLDRDGAQQTLRLPRTAAGGPGLVRVAGRGAAATRASGDAEPPRVIHPVQFSAAQQWFHGLAARAVLDEQGQLVGLKLHPNLRVQAHYGLHSEDVVTAVNGVPIEGDVDVEALLARSSSPSLALTVTHDGAVRTLTVPVN